LSPGCKVSGGKVLSSHTRKTTNRVAALLRLAAVEKRRPGAAMSIITISVSNTRALVSVDTRTSFPDGASRESSKLNLVPHLNTIIARGTGDVIRKRHGQIELRQLIRRCDRHLGT
jgi:hypothetical protein